MKINAEEARYIAKQNSDYNKVMAEIYDAIRKTSLEGKFCVVVKPGFDFKFTCFNELESYGFTVDDVLHGIYSEGEIKIKW